MSDGDIIVFFVDRSLGRNHVPNALKDAGEIVEASTPLSFNFY
jgi:hypothetical protein